MLVCCASCLEAAAIPRPAGKARGASERSVLGYVSTWAHEQRAAGEANRTASQRIATDG
jgi:hypothetical protein